jgi:hypothetical protein
MHVCQAPRHGQLKSAAYASSSWGTSTYLDIMSLTSTPGKLLIQVVPHCLSTSTLSRIMRSLSYSLALCFIFVATGHSTMYPAICIAHVRAVKMLNQTVCFTRPLASLKLWPLGHCFFFSTPQSCHGHSPVFKWLLRNIRFAARPPQSQVTDLQTHSPGFKITLN